MVRNLDFAGRAFLVDLELLAGDLGTEERNLAALLAELRAMLKDVRVVRRALSAEILRSRVLRVCESNGSRRR